MSRQPLDSDPFNLSWFVENFNLNLDDVKQDECFSGASILDGGYEIVFKPGKEASAKSLHQALKAANCGWQYWEFSNTVELNPYLKENLLHHKEAYELSKPMGSSSVSSLFFDFTPLVSLNSALEKAKQYFTQNDQINMIQQLTCALTFTRAAACKINSYKSKQEEYDRDGFKAHAPINFSKGDCLILDTFTQFFIDNSDLLMSANVFLKSKFKNIADEDYYESFRELSPASESPITVVRLANALKFLDEKQRKSDFVYILRSTIASVWQFSKPACCYETRHQMVTPEF